MQLKHVKWNKNIEKLLKEKQFKCIKYSWLHLRDSQRYNNLHNYIFYINTVFTSISATSVITSNGLASDITPETLNVINIIFGIILVFSTMLNAFQHQTNYSELANKHKIASAKFSSLANNMLKLLALDEESKQTSLEYFTWADSEYTELEIQSPNPTTIALKAYAKENGDIENRNCIHAEDNDNDNDNGNNKNEYEDNNEIKENEILINRDDKIEREIDKDKEKKKETGKFLTEFRNKRFINNQSF